MNDSNLRVLITEEVRARAPNNVLRECLNVFGKVVVAGYTPEGDLHVYACEGITEGDMALLALKLQMIANTGWVKEEDTND